MAVTFLPRLIAGNRLHRHYCSGALGILVLGGSAVPGLAAQNRPPSVALVSPTNTVFSPGTNLVLQATASDPDGMVTRVEFLNQGDPLATVEEPPYLFVWTNVPAGNHIVAARAVDDAGAASVSAPLSLLVGVDASLPRLRVADAFAREGNSGTTPLNFVLTLSGAAGTNIAVDYTTTEGTAVAPVDYIATNGTVTFPAGKTQALITVEIRGNTLNEPNRRLFLDLRHPVNAVVERARATGVIVDDEPGAGKVHYFEWQLPATNLAALAPVPVTLVARDVLDGEVTDVIGSVRLRAKAPATSAFRILGDLAPTESTASSTNTHGYAFWPSTNLWVTHFHSYGGVKVSLWTDDGTLLATEALPYEAAWRDVPLRAPVLLQAGRRYRLAHFTAGQSDFSRSDSANSFEHGSIESACSIGLDAFPTESSSARWPSVDIQYSLEPVPDPAAGRVTPGEINLEDGRWTGALTLSVVGEGLRLVAEDGFGHTGQSGPLTLRSPSGGFAPLVALVSPLNALPNPQTGLFEQRLRLQNLGLEAVESAVVTITNLPSNVRAYLAGLNSNGLPELRLDQTLAPGKTIGWLVEYYDPTRRGQFQPRFIIEIIPAPPVVPPSGEVFDIRRAQRLADGSFLVEFDAAAGTIVSVQYSDDFVQWETAQGTVTGTGQRVIWLDQGPPKTNRPPAANAKRFYRLVVSRGG